MPNKWLELQAGGWTPELPAHSTRTSDVKHTETFTLKKFSTTIKRGSLSTKINIVGVPSI
jgi:hypothetical protein